MAKKLCSKGKSTKFDMVIVLGLPNNISYGPQSGGHSVLGGGGWLQFPN